MILGIACHLCCTVHWALSRLLETANDSDIDKLLTILLFIFQFRYRNNDDITIAKSTWGSARSMFGWLRPRQRMNELLLPSVQSPILQVRCGGGRFSARVRKPCKK